jgi:hypothetical protein
MPGVSWQVLGHEGCCTQQDTLFSVLGVMQCTFCWGRWQEVVTWPSVRAEVHAAQGRESLGCALLGSRQCTGGHAVERRMRPAGTGVGNTEASIPRPRLSPVLARASCRMNNCSLHGYVGPLQRTPYARCMRSASTACPSDAQTSAGVSSVLAPGTCHK